MCQKAEAVIVGGGNSAGQAAVFLSRFAAKVWILVRGKSLSESMSRYLIDRIEATENITVLTETELVALSGSPKGQLDRVRWRHKPTGRETEKPIHNVFVMIGADPATGWLEGCGVALDEKRFIQTGSAVPNADIKASGAADRPLPLESSQRGIFAVGDVRSGSVKRVGAAIGEGAAVVAEIHAALEAAPSSG
jgi:thioredoxin reductase (NADPH)